MRARTTIIILLLAATATPIAHAAPSSPGVAFAQLPLHFEANAGQDDQRVLYSSRDAGQALFLTADSVVFAPAGAVDPVEMHLVGADRTARTSLEQPLPGRSHYLRGTDRKGWTRNVAHYGRVRYAGVWPGVDLVYYGNQGQLEYDFIVAPGADPAAIRMRADGASIDLDGNVLLGAAEAGVVLKKPVSFQTVAGARRSVAADYHIERSGGHDEIVIALGDYDRSRALVIDPVVEYSTYLGSRKLDEAYAVAVDADGNAYLTGATLHSDFPVQVPFDASFNGGGYDAFVSKLSADGQTLLYSTYLGGTGYDYGQSIVVDSSGNVLVSGSTSSTNFPTGGVVRPYAGGGDAFVVKLSPDGAAILWGTYLGGTSSEGGRSLALDPAGNAYVAGVTWSADFPAYRGKQMTFGGGSFDAFVAKLSGIDGALVYATFLGGSEGEWLGGLAVDGLGRAYVIGHTASANFPTAAAMQPAINGVSDVFVSRLSASGKALTYSTFLGGSDQETGNAITVDSNNAAYITGATASINFPTVNSLQAPLAVGGGLPRYDAFVAKIASDGGSLRFSTYLGGLNSDTGNGIALDAARNVYVAGNTQSSDFPAVNPFQTSEPAYGGTNFDAFVTKLTTNGAAIAFSSPLGGPNYDFADGLALDGQNRMYVAGRSGGGFPTVNALYPTNRNDDAFVARISQDADAERDVIEFTKDVYAIDESTELASIWLKRTGAGYGGVSAHVVTDGGTATFGYDYYDFGSYVFWNHAQMLPRRFTLPVIADVQHDEPVETVLLELQSVSGFAEIGPRHSAVLRIRNSETGQPQSVNLTMFFGPEISTAGNKWSVPGTVVVSNRAGSGMAGVTVSLSVLAEAFQKGSSEFAFWDDGRPSHWGPVYQASPFANGFGCASEDLDGDGVLDAGEDLNGNGTLEPGAVGIVPASVVTDATGTAHFDLSYLKTQASWVRVRVRSQTAGEYASSAQTVLIGLQPDPAVLLDPNKKPPNFKSPYGLTADCSDPS